VSDTQTVDRVLTTAQHSLGRAAERAAGESRWAVACNYLALAGRLAQYRETQRIWPEQPLASSLLWRTAGDCERLADTAQREDWLELGALTEAEGELQYLAAQIQTEEERA
jgi:hypothetical protein